MRGDSYGKEKRFTEKQLALVTSMPAGTATDVRLSGN